MNISYKKMIVELLESKGLKAESFTSLPDYKSVHTFSTLGFYGTVGGKSWKQVYLKLRKEFKNVDS